MLTITIPGSEIYNEITNCFTTIKEQKLQLEHSLVSISKWESKWKKPFLTEKPKTREETLDYVRCMTITQNVDPNAYHGLTNENIKVINDYIGDPMTATTFSNRNRRMGKRSIITSEVIYYWMVYYGIPMECQRWHLNRLMTLIRICNEKEQPGKKMSKRDIMSQNRSLNQARRAKSGSRG